VNTGETKLRAASLRRMLCLSNHSDKAGVTVTRTGTNLSLLVGFLLGDWRFKPNVDNLEKKLAKLAHLVFEEVDALIGRFYELIRGIYALIHTSFKRVDALIGRFYELIRGIYALIHTSFKRVDALIGRLDSGGETVEFGVEFFSKVINLLSDDNPELWGCDSFERFFGGLCHAQTSLQTPISVLVRLRTVYPLTLFCVKRLQQIFISYIDSK
jgi:hypothetical protein